MEAMLHLERRSQLGRAHTETNSVAFMVFMAAFAFMAFIANTAALTERVRKPPKNGLRKKTEQK